MEHVLLPDNANNREPHPDSLRLFSSYYFMKLIAVNEKDTIAAPSLYAAFHRLNRSYFANNQSLYWHATVEMCLFMMRISKVARQSGLLAWKADLYNVEFSGETVYVGGRDSRWNSREFAPGRIYWQ